MNYIVTTLTLMILCIINPILAHSQQRMDKYDLAITYEQQGDHRNAARIFQELYAESPNQARFLQGVIRSLTALQRYVELLPILEVELAKKPGLELYSIASQTAKKANQHQKSQTYFEQSLALLDGLPNDYEKEQAIRIIAKMQSDIGATENALATFLKGRAILSKNKDVFADELSMIYVQMGNVEMGIKEIAKAFKQHQQYGLIQGRIAALLIDDKAQSYIDAELSTMTGNDYAFSRIYVWFLREIKAFDKAFSQALSIDTGLGLQGREILDFADIALRDGHFELALKAFANVIDRGKNNPHFSQALYGYAKALDQRLQLNSEKKDIPQSEIESIINRYQDIIAQSPKGQFAAECLYRIGSLESSYLKNESAAKTTFQQVFDVYKQYPISASALNELTRIAIASNDIDEAFNLAAKTAKGYANSNPKEADKAQFSLAELYLFKGEIDSCKTMLIGLAGKTDSDIANDALELSLFLEQHKQFTAGLILWGKALLSERQFEEEDAIELYKEIIKKTSGSDLAEQAHLKVCERSALIDMNLAFKEGNDFLSTYPESINTDKVLFLLAEISITSNKNAEAITYLTDILVRFPNSRFVTRSRELIRKLRGES